MKKQKHYTEAELVILFNLDKQKKHNKALQNWIDAPKITLTHAEQGLFDDILQNIENNLEAWNEEDLKMNFISFVLKLANFMSNHYMRTYFEKTVEAMVENTFLKVKTDFMIAKGVLDLPQKPYFHFQEYKPEKKPTGDSMAQLLECFLIAQTINNNQKPIYGVEVNGSLWRFVLMQGREYAISQPYIATKKEELLQIIAILRHFKVILERDLLD
jgi:hypothetical protein